MGIEEKELQLEKLGYIAPKRGKQAERRSNMYKLEHHLGFLRCYWAP